LKEANKRLTDIEKAISALESIMRDDHHDPASIQLVTLKQYCVDLSRLDCILPGAYVAATALLDAVQAAMLHSRSITEPRISTAVQLLRDLAA
jgi:hypothetical protein